ncbi:hypothetical protein [Halalkalibacter sp. APA_J-10(15)]|uniref:hypothetical protein n=1 Tax=Halalkalibacter sp. APA_J-10(15) TaxID=2933805 RepID=UPI001FF62280|nr:hypothetical protein [Halalkalibacter sp. APA_J-10(15)]MCK0470536.1 hypothetical protein [Halalkalibacter sp. APA_J-10(15)]
MAIAPVVIVGAIVVFVIGRLKHQYNEGKLGKMKSKSAQGLLDSLIPIGMVFGCNIGIVVGLFLPISVLFATSLGAGFGYLFGYFAYDMYSRKDAVFNK